MRSVGASVRILLCAVVFCCATATATLSASIRSDKWRPDLMIHGAPAPKSGRRVHIVADGVAANITDAQLASVLVGGQECLNLTTDGDIGYLHWCRAHTNAATGQLWVSLHSANTTWVEGALTLVLLDELKEGDQVAMVEGVSMPALEKLIGEHMPEGLLEDEPEAAADAEEED